MSKEEAWTGISEEELEKAGFKLKYPEDKIYVHPKWEWMGVVFREEDDGYWIINLTPHGWLDLRYVKYMYQIDNMFHGFTDRWLGLI